MTRRRVAAGGALVLLAAVTAGTVRARPAVAVAPAGGPPPSISSGVSPNPSGTTMRLVSQTTWVTPGAPFNLAIDVHTSEPADQVLVSVDVYSALGSRSEFARSIMTGWSGYILSRPVRNVPLDTLHTDESGTVHISLPTGRLINQLHVTTPGVYPVAVTLRTRGIETPISRFMTDLVSTPATAADKLNVVWVVPVHALPTDPSARTAALPAATTASLNALVDALANHPKVPVTLEATPDTLASLMVGDQLTVSRLGQSLTGREVLASTWVPVPIPSMLAAGLGTEVSLSLTRGSDALTADLGTEVSGRTWVQQGPVDQGTLSFLRFAQFDRVVLPEADLGPNPDPQGKTPVQPFEVAGSDQTLIRAAVADAALASHFVDQPDHVLAAHQLLADLAQVYGDAPNDPSRGVVVVPPTSWVPDAGFVNAVLGGLQSSPILAGQKLDTFFDAVAPESGKDGGPLIRQVAVDDATIRAIATGLLPDGERQAASQLDALARLLPESTKVYPPLERLLLETPSTDLTPTERQVRLFALGLGMRAVLGQVQLPTTRTITLTARTGHLPITVVSLSDEPLQVLLQVESDKLKFAGGGASNSATFPLTLHKGNNPIIDLTVEARTSGAFPLHLTVLTPDGSMVITRTTFTVQSTALSGVGVLLSVGAGLFLVLWWTRHAWKTRQATRVDDRRHARGRGDVPVGDDVAPRERTPVLAPGQPTGS